METTIVALILITLILFGAMTLAQAYLSAQDQIFEASRAMEQRMDVQSRTSLQPVGTAVSAEGDAIELTIRNDGHVKLADFGRWDVIVEYDAAGATVARWLPYSGRMQPGVNEWALEGLYLDAAQAAAEAYEPGILDPGEEMVVKIRVSPALEQGTTNLVTIGTPNGISASAVFRP